MLTAVDMKGSGEYHEGTLVRVIAPRCNQNGMFAGFGGNAEIVWQEDVQALVRVGAQDAEIYPTFAPLGENVAFGKPCRANHTRTAPGEVPENALNGNCTSKWSGLVEKADTETGHAGWLEVDLGEVTSISKWLVQNSGEYENRDENTVDFFLQYKTDADSEWLTADEVWGNREDLTLRDFSPVNARYVRLFIIRPALSSDVTCRIFQFHIYKTRQ